MKRLIVFTIVLLMLSYAAAEQGYRAIGAEELKKLMDVKNRIVVVDARPAQEYSLGHIPDAINIAPEQLQLIGSLLPKNRKTEVVFYCRGVG